jgi:hypothetical protein
MTGLLAHAIGGVRDLPIALWLFYYGAAIVLVLSFMALGVLWRRARLEGVEGRGLVLAGGRMELVLGRRLPSVSAGGWRPSSSLPSRRSSWRTSSRRIRGPLPSRSSSAAG